MPQRKAECTGCYFGKPQVKETELGPSNICHDDIQRKWFSTSHLLASHGICEFSVRWSHMITHMWTLLGSDTEVHHTHFRIRVLVNKVDQGTVYYSRSSPPSGAHRRRNSGSSCDSRANGPVLANEIRCWPMKSGVGQWNQVLANEIRCCWPITPWTIQLIADVRPARVLPFAPKKGFPGNSDGKESVWDAGDLGVIPGLGRSPGEGDGYLLQYPCLENSMDRGAVGQTIDHGVAKSRTRLSD